MGIVSKLKKVYGITTKKSPQTGVQGIVPAKYDTETKKLVPLKMTPEIEQLYNFFLRENLDTAEALKNRFDRYKQLSYAFYNSTIFSQAIKLYTEEAIQADEQNEILQVYAKKKDVEKEIYSLFSKINLNSNKLYDILFNLFLYADAFAINTFEEGVGLTELTPISVFSVLERIEFNLARINEARYKKIKTFFLNSGIEKLKFLTQTIVSKELDKETKANYFKDYLFGYELDNNIFLAPWEVSHFRLYSSQSEFAPYGRPILINCLSPFKQLQSAKNLMAIARANSFPIKLFKVKVSETMSPIDVWKAVREAREEYQNLIGDVQKERFTVNNEVWLPDDSLTIDTIDTNVNMDQIADIEMLADELADGTGIPADYLRSSKASWGVSGKALFQQSKIFARGCYGGQSALLEVLTHLVRLHFIVSGKFDYNEEFEISLNYPVVEEDSDRQRAKQDTLTFAKEIIDTIKDTTGVEGPLPPDILKQILNNYTFLSNDEIEAYVDAAVEEYKKANSGDNGDYNFEDNVLMENRRKIQKRLDESIIRDSYFNIKKNRNMQETTKNGKHTYTSFIMDENSKLQYDVLTKNYESKKIKG